MGRSDSPGEELRSDIGRDRIPLFKAQNSDSMRSPHFPAFESVEEGFPAVGDCGCAEVGTGNADLEEGFRGPHHRDTRVQKLWRLQS